MFSLIICRVFLINQLFLLNRTTLVCDSEGIFGGGAIITNTIEQDIPTFTVGTTFSTYLLETPTEFTL